MNRTDQATRRATTVIVAAVALFAADDSFSHVYSLARLHYQGVVSAALLPLAGDGLVAAASSAPFSEATSWPVSTAAYTAMMKQLLNWSGGNVRTPLALFGPFRWRPRADEA